MQALVVGLTSLACSWVNGKNGISDGDSLNRRNHCLEILFLLFKFVTSETKESFVTRTNGSLVGALISRGEVSVSIAIVTYQIKQ